MTESRRVRFRGPETPFVRYALSLIEDFAEVAFVRCGDDPFPADVGYGDASGPARLRIPQVAAYTRDTVPGLPAERPRGAAPDRFPYDVFAALRFWLADEGNATAGGGDLDAHDRLVAARSAQEHRGLREVPIVNAYLCELREWLESRVGIARRSRLPPGRSATVVLSHDVDGPLHPADPRNRLWAAGRELRSGRPRAALGVAAHAVARAAALAAVRPRWPHWRFGEIRAAEERRGFRSTFFFAAVSRYDRHGTPFDVAYDVAAPRFRRLFAELRQSGWPIGLHVGYGARDDAGEIARQRERLEALSGAPVLGSRHHYWHLAAPPWASLEAHGRASLRYDSSLAFNEAPGYRLGAALAFRPFHPGEGRAVATLQVPTLAMDGAFFYRPGQSVEATLEAMARLLDSLKRYEGVAAIDWHDYTSVPSRGPYARWGQAYVGLLDLIAEDPAIEVATYDDVLRREADRTAAVPA